jgi:hypothetical protein
MRMLVERTSTRIVIERFLTWGADPKVGGVTLLLSARFANGSERMVAVASSDPGPSSSGLWPRTTDSSLPKDKLN